MHTQSARFKDSETNNDNRSVEKLIQENEALKKSNQELQKEISLQKRASQMLLEQIDKLKFDLQMEKQLNQNSNSTSSSSKAMPDSFSSEVTKEVMSEKEIKNEALTWMCETIGKEIELKKMDSHFQSNYQLCLKFYTEKSQFYLGVFMIRDQSIIKNVGLSKEGAMNLIKKIQGYFGFSNGLQRANPLKPENEKYDKSYCIAINDPALTELIQIRKNAMKNKVELN